jgi:uncharacterized coiled-coil protein SlyX
MKISEHGPTILSATALLLSATSATYTLKRLNELQKEVDELSDKVNDQEKKDTGLGISELQAQINQFQSKMDNVLGRLTDAEEDGITSQHDIDDITSSIQEWARGLLDEMKSVKPDTQLRLPALPDTSQLMSSGRGGIGTHRGHNSGGGGHHHHTSRNINNSSRNKRSASVDDDDDGIGARFRHRRR